MADFVTGTDWPSGGARVVHQDTGLIITASGHSDDFTVRGYRTLWVAVFLQAVAGTSSPTVTFYLEQEDANGHWVITTQIGVGVTSGPNYTAGYAGEAPGGMLAGKARIAWSVTGTDPSFTGVDLSVIGR
jgi:hypothetical protein